MAKRDEIDGEALLEAVTDHSVGLRGMVKGLQRFGPRPAMVILDTLEKASEKFDNKFDREKITAAKAQTVEQLKSLTNDPEAAARYASTKASMAAMAMKRVIGGEERTRENKVRALIANAIGKL